MNFDLKTYMFSENQNTDEVSKKIEKTSIALLALFTIDHALAKLFMNWGITPKAMIGHSLGEYTAACLSGVLSLQDAISLVTLRGKLFEKLPEGAMLSVPLSEKEVQLLLVKGLSIAAINAHSLSVVSGAADLIDLMEKNLIAKGLETRKLHISVAAHSEMAEPILKEFEEFVIKLKPSKPLIPYVSNVTGKWITDEDALDPIYWVRHIRKAVRFAEGIGNVLMDKENALLEVGPGQTLNIFSRQHPEAGKDRAVLTSLRHPYEEQSDEEFLQKTIAKLWLAGVQIDWNMYYEDEQRVRVSLPTYVFDKQRHWVDYPGSNGLTDNSQAFSSEKEDPSNWFYMPIWKPSFIVKDNKDKIKSIYIVFVDDLGIGQELINHLRMQNNNVIIVRIGEQFSKIDKNTFLINPNSGNDYEQLFYEADKNLKVEYDIVHMWNITSAMNEFDLESFKDLQSIGFYSIINIGKALRKINRKSKIKLTIVSNNLNNVNGEEKILPSKSTILSPIIVIPQENVNLFCTSIDIRIDNFSKEKRARLINSLIAEINLNHTDVIVVILPLKSTH